MKFILAEKKEMTQKFAADGRVIPVTRVVAGPCTVVQVKNVETDGYLSVQLGFGLKRKISNPLKGHLKNLGNFRYLREFRIDNKEAEILKVGTKVSVDNFAAGDIIQVTGTSKGKGFQGVVKRHGFHGSPKTHGHKDQLRMPGSIGSTGPQHVFKGTRMGGRMGGDQVTVHNLEVVEVNNETGEIFIKGAIPGGSNNLLMIAGEGDINIMTEVEAVLTPAVEVKVETTEVPTEEVKSDAEAIKTPVEAVEAVSEKVSE